MTSVFKKDKYRRARGGYSRKFNVRCAKCNAHIFDYQKDGPGPLKRTYLDRIQDGARYAGVSKLVCPKCKELLGVATIYAKEKRKAFRLFEGAVSKKIAKTKLT